ILRVLQEKNLRITGWQSSESLANNRFPFILKKPVERIQPRTIAVTSRSITSHQFSLPALSSTKEQDLSNGHAIEPSANPARIIYGRLLLDRRQCDFLHHFVDCLPFSQAS